MKRQMGLFLVLITFCVSFTSGCVVRSHRTVVVHEPAVTTAPPELIVTTEPPAPRHEVVGVAPSPRHVWIEGYWTYHEGRWVWNPGHWEVRPRRGALWVAGHWDRTPRGWVWRPGHWA